MLEAVKSVKSLNVGNWWQQLGALLVASGSSTSTSSTKIEKENYCIHHFRPLYISIISKSTFCTGRGDEERGEDNKVMNKISLVVLDHHKNAISSSLICKSICLYGIFPSYE